MIAHQKHPEPRFEVGQIVAVIPGDDWPQQDSDLVRGIAFEITGRSAYHAFSKTGRYHTWLYTLEDASGDMYVLEAELVSLDATRKEPEYNAFCPRCNAWAYQGLNEIECSAKCTPETTARGSERKPEANEQTTIPF